MVCKKPSNLSAARNQNHDVLQDVLNFKYLNISFLCSNSGQTVTCTPCSWGSSSFLQGWPLAAVPALSTAMPFPFSLVLLVWYLGLKAHLSGGSECCEDAAPACACQKGSFNSVSHNSCPSSPHEYSGCNTKVLGGPREHRMLILALAVSAWLLVCLRAASGESLGSLQTFTSISTILWAPKALPYRERVRAKLHT